MLINKTTVDKADLADVNWPQQVGEGKTETELRNPNEET